jgi:hypothetical protein
MKKNKSLLKISKVRIANLNEISNLLGGTDGGPDTTTKGKDQSVDGVECVSRVKVHTICVDNNPQTDP